MSKYSGLSIKAVVDTIDAVNDDKALAVCIADWMYVGAFDEKDRRFEDENDIKIYFDWLVTQIILDMKDCRLPMLSLKQHAKLSKSGVWIRYAATDLLRFFKAHVNTSKHPADGDLEEIMFTAIDRKIEEDTVKPEDEAEVDKIINETEEIMSGVDDEEDTDNPFYEKSNDNEINEEETNNETA